MHSSPRRRWRFLAPALLLAGLTASLAPLVMPNAAQAGTTLDAIRRNGYLRCGVSGVLAGMSLPDSQGRMQGFDAEICRTVAAAVFGDAEKVRFVPVTTSTRFTALQSGEIDMLSRTTALTIARDATMGLAISVPTFYTGQVVMVNKRLNITSATQLDGATVCAVQASEIERNLSDYARAHNIHLTTVAFDTTDTVMNAFLAGRCDAVSNDVLSLSGGRVRAPNPGDFLILPEYIAKEPHGIMVRRGDDEWFTLTRWAFFALLQAEEMGLTKENVAEIRKTTKDPKIQRFLGVTDNVGTGLGLPADWAFKVIQQQGNYGEIYDRFLGPKGLDVPRGINRLWTNGGMQISWLWQ